MMGPIFEYDLDATKNLGFEKYPHLDDLVETKLPQEIQIKIAELVFDGEISDIFETSGEHQGWSDDVFEECSSNFEKLNEILLSYFNEKVMQVLRKKSIELLAESRFNKDECAKIIAWYKDTKETAEVMLQRWMKEAMDYARDVEEKMNKASELTV